MVSPLQIPSLSHLQMNTLAPLPCGPHRFVVPPFFALPLHRLAGVLPIVAYQRSPAHAPQSSPLRSQSFPMPPRRSLNTVSPSTPCDAPHFACCGINALGHLNFPPDSPNSTSTREVCHHSVSPTRLTSARSACLPSSAKTSRVAMPTP